MEVHLIDGTYELFRHFYALPSARDSEDREVAAVRSKVCRAAIVAGQCGRRPGQCDHTGCDLRVSEHGDVGGRRRIGAGAQDRQLVSAAVEYGRQWVAGQRSHSTGRALRHRRRVGRLCGLDGARGWIERIRRTTSHHSQQNR